jgi:type IV fimbrial biogenesis protein FimT
MTHSHFADQPRGQRGVTLIELMVTLTVLGIVLTLGVPSFASLIAANRITTQTNEFIGALNLTRSEAVRRGYAVSIRSNATSGNNFAAGWQVFTDGTTTDGSPASPATATDGMVLRESGALSGNASVKRVTRSGTSGSYTYANSTGADALYLTFTARGANNAGAANFYKICDSANTSVKGRIVQVSTSGKVSLESASETCI